jgi:hypothetical protein
MTELKYVLVEELLNALDDIQNTIPAILDYYMDSTLDPEDNIHMDIELLAMNITGLRDSAKLIRDSISINVEVNNVSQISVSPQVKQIALAMFLHTHMLTDTESIYNSGIIGNNNLFGSEWLNNEKNELTF